MAVFEVEVDGRRLQVDAPDMRSALTALSGGQNIGAGRSFIEGLRSGFTANFGDELAGVSAAAQTPAELRNPFDFISDAVRGGAQLGYEALTGKTGASDAYAKRRDEIRADQKAAAQQHPFSNIAGQVAGAVALPVGGALNAATLPARMMRSAAVGAGYGALSGAGEGENLADRATRATTGGLLGGAIGGVAPPIVEGAIQGVTRAAAPMVNAIRGAINPDNEASRRVVTALQRDVRADPNALQRLTPQEFAAAPDSTLMDLGGETTRGLARSAANTSPEGRAALNQTINDRFEGQGGRITDWLRGVFNFPNAHVQQQAIEHTARNTNRTNYAQAYRDGAGGVWSPELERLAGSDAVAAAMQKAASNARDEAIVGGYGAMNPRITFTPDGRMQLGRSPSGVPTYPDLQYWDLVRRELSDAAQRAGRGTSEARRLNNFATSLNSELDRIVPSYQAARQGAAQFFGAENALEAGQNFVMQNFANDATRQALGRMNAMERQLFQDGFVSRYIETLERTGDRRNVLNTIAANPHARDKLEMVLGPQRAAELEARLRVEGIMDLARGAVQGNSTTARQLAEIGFAGGTAGLGGVGAYNMDPTQLGIAAVSAALLAGRRGVDQRVAERVARMLVSNDPQQLARGFQLIARNGRFMESLRATDRRLAEVAGQEAPKGALVQMPTAGRAEDE